MFDIVIRESEGDRFKRDLSSVYDEVICINRLDGHCSGRGWLDGYVCDECGAELFCWIACARECDCCNLLLCVSKAICIIECPAGQICPSTSADVISCWFRISVAAEVNGIQMIGCCVLEMHEWE